MRGALQFMSIIGEFVLEKLSRDPNVGDILNASYESKHNDSLANIAVLKEHFPRIEKLIAGKRVLNIGCAEGLETLAISRLGASYVHGIDIRIDPARNRTVHAQANGSQIQFSVMNATHTSFGDGEFDMVVTCGSFEHFSDPFAVLRECVRVVKEEGLILITSGVWAHPYGAHMNFFTKVPWVQYFFSEKTIMTVRKKYRSDGAMRFCDVEGGLNKVGVRTFLEMVDRLELEIENLQLSPVKGLAILTRIPYIQELFTNLIVAMLKKPCSAAVRHGERSESA